MLRELRIRHLAVIEAMDVEFGPGFTAVTGETGVGKSVLVDAVSLLLGAKASADLVRTGEAQATIEALFETSDGREIVVRREIASHGRSRSFVDGTLATAGTLRSLGLVEVHAQHEHQALLDPAAHLPFLDAYAGLDPDARTVAEAWHALAAAREACDRARMDGRERAARLDLLTFQAGEIAAAQPKAGEDDELVAAKRVVANATRIQELCQEGYGALYEGDDAVLGRLAGVWKRVGELATLDDRFGDHLAARDGIKSQLEDLAESLRRYADGIDVAPGRLQEIEDRLGVLERLKRKYGPTIEDVIRRHESMAREIGLLDGTGVEAGRLDATLHAASERYQALARALSSKRRAAADRFASELAARLADLAMAKTRFEVRFTPCAEDAWTERGIDAVEFFVSPNPGEDLRPLARVVSGGELSRLLLALRTLEPAPGGERPLRMETVVFDEVDAGIGGRVAHVVGGQLKLLAGGAQVLCITHLPQIAAQADAHYRLDKRVAGGRTHTTIRRLDDAARVDEIARMLAGAETGPSARLAAQDLLRGAAAGTEAKGKHKAKEKGEAARAR